MIFQLLGPKAVAHPAWGGYLGCRPVRRPCWLLGLYVTKPLLSWALQISDGPPLIPRPPRQPRSRLATGGARAAATARDGFSHEPRAGSGRPSARCLS